MSNNNTFPVIVWKARIRDAHNTWKFFDIECASNVRTTISTSDTVTLTCWRWESVVFEKPGATMALKVIKTKNPSLLWELLDLVVTNTAEWENIITDKKQIFDEDWIIEMLERSNDWNWVTEIVVKSEDGATTYTVDTDYTVKVEWESTFIERVATWTIEEWATVLVSWKVKQYASKEVVIERVQRLKKQFTIELYWEDTKTKRLTSLVATPVTLDSEYLLEMFDVFVDWEPAWAELSFVLADNGKLTFKDENI